MENHELVPDTVSPYPWGARQLSLLVRLRAAHQYTPYELSYYLNTVPQDVTRSFAPTGEVWPLHNQTQLDTDARFIMVAGSPFSGKSMVSALLQQTLQEGGRDALLVRSDVVRYKYLPPDIYTTHESRFGWRANTRTHMHLFADAWHYLWKGGDIVILDATWRDIKARTWANELANAWNMRVQIIEVTTEDESIVKERALTRKGDASSATFASYKRSKASAHPITQPHIVLKNESTLEALLQRVRRIAVNLLPKTATDTV